MKTLSSSQVQQLTRWIKTFSINQKRDLLLIHFGLKAGVKAAHLSVLQVKDVIDPVTGDIRTDITTGTTRTRLPDDLRTEIKDFLKDRFKTDDISGLREVTRPLITNRQTPRESFTDQSLAVHLTYLLRESGIDATSTALRNTFIVDVARKTSDIPEFFHLTGIKCAKTYIKLMLERPVQSELMAD